MESEGHSREVFLISGGNPVLFRGWRDGGGVFEILSSCVRGCLCEDNKPKCSGTGSLGDVVLNGNF
jgi:hypothetical protein